MPRLDVAPDYALLVRLLRNPASLAALSPAEYSRAIDAAEHARLLGWFLTQSEAHGLPDDAPAWLRDRLITVRALVDEYEREIRWEVDRLARALSDVGVPCTLLKGAAYVAATLPPGRGRHVADIDVLVPLDRISEVEAALVEHGWATQALDAYDMQFYREWMHELPPLVHRERGSVVDVHHAILPRTSRLQPPTERLLGRAVHLQAGVQVLCPSHMVLHGAAHLFHDGEIAGAIRDVVDLDALLRHFSKDPSFWDDLVDEARGLGLTRPAFYAARYAHRLLGTPVPTAVVEQLAAARPSPLVQAFMDSFVDRAVSRGDGKASSLAAFALYIRSHWLRMPPLMLARHLWRKSIRRAGAS